VENELRKVVVELKRSNRDLEQFAYVASHDMKEPLNMVVSYLRFSRSDIMAPSVRRRMNSSICRPERDEDAKPRERSSSILSTGGGDKPFESVDCGEALKLAIQTYVFRSRSGAEVTVITFRRCRGRRAIVQLFQNSEQRDQISVRRHSKGPRCARNKR